MTESRPLSRPSRPGSSPGDRSEGSLGPSSSRTSLPPSEPRPSRASFSSLDAAVERPARLQMIVALMLGLVLVAIPLYLWRRPRAESIPVAGGAAAADSGAALTELPPATPDVEPKVTLTEARVLACQDPGPRKTPPEQCDHLVDLEKAFAKAIEDSASCIAKEPGGGTIQFVADVSFKKKTVGVTAPRDGRSIKNAKIAGGCSSVVKSKMHAVSLDALPHQHARYKIAITATYPPSALAPAPRL